MLCCLCVDGEAETWWEGIGAHPPGVLAFADRPSTEPGGGYAGGLAVLDDSTTAVRKRPANLSVFGYYRLFLYSRNIVEPYPGLEPFARAYDVGDGYREPMLSLNIVGRPNGRSSFGTELFVFTPYRGEGAQGNVLSVNLGINFFGNFRTELGRFGIRAGGIHWYNLSPFTIGIYQILDRFSIFDRTPWEGVTGASKYDSYFETGTTNPGDLRWNYQAFQGIILDGRRLPGGFGFDAFWGKTQPNGGLPNAVDDPLSTVVNFGNAGNVPTYIGLGGDARALPSFITGGMLQKQIGSNSAISLNSIYSYRSLDSLTNDRNEYRVHTLAFDATVVDVALSGELGAARYRSAAYEGGWGEALMLRALTPSHYTGLPLDVQIYQISSDFYNENGAIATSGNPAIQGSSNCDVSAGQASSGGPISLVNQLVHNRRGVNINTRLELGPARFAVGWGLASEIDPITTEISYVHRINGLAMSRVYNPFPANAVCATSFGPFGRKYSFFRGVFERVATTDLDLATGMPPGRKHYNAVDVQGKIKGRLGSKDLFLFYLGSFGSAKSSASLLPTHSEYIFVQYHEIDAYVEVVDDFILAGYLGIENARAGRATDLDADTGLPRNQLATGWGLGFDWSIARNAGIYFRHRWMDFEDRNSANDRYRGREATIELKIFI